MVSRLRFPSTSRSVDAFTVVPPVDAETAAARASACTEKCSTFVANVAVGGDATTVAFERCARCVEVGGFATTASRVRTAEIAVAAVSVLTGDGGQIAPPVANRAQKSNQTSAATDDADTSAKIVVRKHFVNTENCATGAECAAG